MAEPAMLRVVTLFEAFARPAQLLRRQRRAGPPRGRGGELFKLAVDVAGRLLQLPPPLPPQVRDVARQLQKARPAMARLRRKIGAAKERLALGREKHA